MKHYPSAKILTFQSKRIKMPSIQNLKCSFKVYSRIFSTFRKMNYDKLKRTSEIRVISTPKSKYYTNIENLSRNYQKEEILQS